MAFATARRSGTGQSFTIGGSQRSPSHTKPIDKPKLHRAHPQTNPNLRRAETFPNATTKSGCYAAQARSDHCCVAMGSKTVEKSVPDKATASGGAGPQQQVQVQRRFPQADPAAASQSRRPSKAKSTGCADAGASSLGATGLKAEVLNIGETWIDPCRPSLKGQLLERLCEGRPAVIERMAGAHGGLNMGVWLLRDGSESLVLKMVTSTRFMGMPTEVEVFVDLARKHPRLMQDKSIAFPIKIFNCIAPDNTRRDLVVMRKAPGECFANIIMQKIDDPRQHSELMSDFEAFGAFLADFHARHRLQHGDCNPANVVYDAANKRFTLIDIADLGSPRIKHTDVEHFSNGIMSFARRHGQAICEDAKRYFEAGYAKARCA